MVRKIMVIVSFYIVGFTHPAYCEYSGIGYEYPQETNDTLIRESTNLYQLVKVDTNMIDRFNKFLKKAFPESYEKYLIDFANIDNRDINALREKWQRYMYGNFEYQDSIERAELENHIRDSILMAQAKDSAIMEIAKTGSLTESQANNIYKLASDSNTSISVTVTVSNGKKPAKLIKNNREIHSSNTDNSISSAQISNPFNNKQLEYRVQIAASRRPLNNNEITDIYAGSANIQESFEDSWYKYITGKFENYSEAKAFRSECNVNGAFVVYYYQGKRTYEPGNISFQSSENSREYKIQIAASHKPLSNNELKNIYQDVESIETYKDSIWCHYVINCGTEYKQAKEKLIDIKVNGAFIVIYSNGIRIYPPLPMNIITNTSKF